MKKKNSDRIKLNKKSKRVLLIVLAIIVIAFVARILINTLGKEEVVEEKGIPVQVEKVENNSFEKYIEVFATARAEKESQIIPKNAAVVESIHVIPGQIVKKGDVLFTMNSEDLDSQIKQAEATYDMAKSNSQNTVGALNEQRMQELKTLLNSAKINYEDAKVNHERGKLLFESGGISKKDFEQMTDSLDLAKSQYETAKKNYDLYVNEIQGTNADVAASQVKQAEATYDSVKKQYDDMTVRSDIDGEVGIIKVEVGRAAGNGQTPVMTVSDYRKIILDIPITEENLNRINKDSKCEVKFDIFEDKVFSGRIQGISSSADPQTGLYQVKVEIDNPSKSIKPGMHASVKLYDKVKNNVISIAIDTAIKENEDYFVFVLKSDNTVEKRNIVVSDDNGERLIVSSGLSVGETVVVKGQDYLDDKEPVRIVTE
ncbi:MAG: efflux RND transporter periplasmic adaptor subunit [Proteocatella sp.]